MIPKSEIRQYQVNIFPGGEGFDHDSYMAEPIVTVRSDLKKAVPLETNTLIHKNTLNMEVLTKLVKLGLAHYEDVACGVTDGLMVSSVGENLLKELLVADSVEFTYHHENEEAE